MRLISLMISVLLAAPAAAQTAFPWDDNTAIFACGHVRLNRFFDVTIGILFGAAPLKLLTTRLNP
jgi:threonine efflux protein